MKNSIYTNEKSLEFESLGCPFTIRVKFHYKKFREYEAQPFLSSSYSTRETLKYSTCSVQELCSVNRVNRQYTTLIHPSKYLTRIRTRPRGREKLSLLGVSKFKKRKEKRDVSYYTFACDRAVSRVFATYGQLRLPVISRQVWH